MKIDSTYYLIRCKTKLIMYGKFSKHFWTSSF